MASLCACGCGLRPAKPGAEYKRGHRPVTDIAILFWPKVKRGPGCWEWQASVRNSRLRSEEVAQIRSRNRPGRGGNTRALAAEYGITPQYVRQLVNGRWRTDG